MKATIKLEGKDYNQMPDLNANDIGLTLTFTIRQFNEALVDLTSGTINFKIKEINSITNKIDGTCVLAVDPTSGQCTYTTLSGDLDTTGVYDSELQVTLGSQITTIPLGRFKINQDLPN